MKTLAYQDRAGGRIHIYWSDAISKMKRHQRIEAARKDLAHTGNIRIFLVKGGSPHVHKKIGVKGY